MLRQPKTLQRSHSVCKGLPPCPARVPVLCSIGQGGNQFTPVASLTWCDRFAGSAFPSRPRPFALSGPFGTQWQDFVHTRTSRPTEWFNVLCEGA